MATVIDALRRFLPVFLRSRPPLGGARRRAVWAITHCRTPEMGGHLHACAKCHTREFRFHSCNHRACPQCGAADTARWVERELSKRVGAPYFMVTFTLPPQLRGLFFGEDAGDAYRMFFAAASGAMKTTLANPRRLGADTCGFTAILHTWNQRLHFHPHIHMIVPGAGLDTKGDPVTVKNENFLVPVPVLRREFRKRFRQELKALGRTVDPAVWRIDWGVNIQPFGSGANAIKYLGAYVCRTAIGDSRVLAVTDTHVTFRWTDRAHNNARRTETIPGEEFVARYLRHVLPRGMRAIRRYGFCHPAAKAKRERVAFHTGMTLLVGDFEQPAPKAASAVPCPCCGEPMARIWQLPPAWSTPRAPPPANQPTRRCA